MTFSFKKTLVAAATLSALAIASPSFADNHSDHDNTNYKKWVGVFGQYYHPDGDKPNEIGGGFLQDGAAVGGEFGIRFTPRWAMRIEAAKTNVDVENNAFGVGSVDGQKIAADALYFQDDLQTYLFTGLQHADDDFDEPDLSLNVDECKAYQETNESYEKKYPKVQQALNSSFVK